MISILICHFLLSILGFLTIMLQWCEIGEIARIFFGTIETIIVSIVYIKIGKHIWYEYDEKFKPILRIFSISVIIILGGVFDFVSSKLTSGCFLSVYLNLSYMPLFAIFQGIFDFKYNEIIYIILGLFPSLLMFTGYHFNPKDNGK